MVLNVSDTGRAGDSWSEAPDTHAGAIPIFSCRAMGGGPRLHLDATDRTHVDLWAAEEDERLAEVERLQALGAMRAARRVVGDGRIRTQP